MAVEFHNAKQVIQNLLECGLAFAVLEHDGVRGYACVAAFGIPSDARKYADRLAELGSQVEVVDLEKQAPAINALAR